MPHIIGQQGSQFDPTVENDENDRDYGDEDGMSQVERNETDEEVVVDEICLK